MKNQPKPDKRLNGSTSTDYRTEPEKIIWEVDMHNKKRRIAIIGDGIALHVEHRIDSGNYRQGCVPETSWHPWIKIGKKAYSPEWSGKGAQTFFDLRQAKRWCEKKLKEVTMAAIPPLAKASGGVSLPHEL